MMIRILTVTAILVSSLAVLSPAAGATIVEVSAPIGVVGCSNTSQAITGYEAVRGTQFWDADSVRALSGGSLELWAQPDSRYWDYLRDMRREYPETETIWWQICLRAENEMLRFAPTVDQQAQAEFVLAGIRRFFPDATIYVSPLNKYDDIVCRLTGEGGPQAAARITRDLVRTTNVVTGPQLAGLDRSMTDDGCHARIGAMRVWGAELVSYFG